MRPGTRGSVAIAILIGVVAVGIVAALSVHALGGNSDAATPKASLQPSKSLQHEAGVLSSFVYERGSYWGGGNVKACQPNWHPASDERAQLHCVSFGQPTVYTRFNTVAEAVAYFDKLSSNGRPGSGNWGPCIRLLPASAWKRSILQVQEHGHVAFRQEDKQAFSVWIWPNMRTVAQVTGSIEDRPQVCRAWDLDA
jgi:hypothetical protein